MTAVSATRAENAIRTSLRDGEQLLWIGGPDPSRLLSREDAFVIPFSLLWCGFAIFWLIFAMRAGGLFWLFGVPFVLVGLYMVFGRLIVKRSTRRGMRYAITSRRALVAGASGSLVDTNLASEHVSTTRHKDGSHADVRFGSGPGGAAAIWDNTGMEKIFPTSAGIAFYDVADPEPMLRALEQARSA